jgi:hypothetical protein
VQVVRTLFTIKWYFACQERVQNYTERPDVCGVRASVLTDGLGRSVGRCTLDRVRVVLKLIGFSQSEVRYFNFDFGIDRVCA